MREAPLLVVGVLALFVAAALHSEFILLVELVFLGAVVCAPSSSE